MSPYVFCVVDLDRFGVTGFSVIESPARFLASYDLGPPITLDLVANKMRDIKHARRYLQRFYNLPVMRIGPV